MMIDPSVFKSHRQYPGLYFEEFEVGMTFTTPFDFTPVTVTAESIAQFAALTGDKNPLHTDPAFAARAPFKKIIAHGMSTLDFVLGKIDESEIIHGTCLAFLGSRGGFRFSAPVFPGDTLTLNMTTTEKKEITDARGIVTFFAVASNQHGTEVCRMYLDILVMKHDYFETHTV